MFELKWVGENVQATKGVIKNEIWKILYKLDLMIFGKSSQT